MSLLGNSVISLVHHKTLENANLLEEEKGHEPHNGRESRRHGTREEIRVVLQKPVVAEQVGEPFRRTRKCSPNDGSIPKLSQNSVVRTSCGGWGNSPQSRPGRRSDRLVRICQRRVRMVGQFSNDASDHSKVAIERTTQSAAGSL